MALPTRNDAKSYLRIETTAEDTLLDSLLARAQALIEGALGYPLTAVERTHVDYEEVDNYGVRPQIALPGPFKTSSPAPVVTDREGATVDPSLYDLDARGLRIRAKIGTTFMIRPYTVVATIGLSVHPDYAAKLEPIVSVAILDLVAYLYRERHPAVSAYTDEGGASVTLERGELSPSLLPARVRAAINLLPGRRGGRVLA